MSSHNVEYQISLKDLLSGKIKQAEGHVNHFEGTLEHAHDLTKELMGAAAGFFGLYQGVEFLKGSIEAYNNVEKSLSQLRAGLESTHGAAGVTYEELTEGAERFAATTIYNKEVLLDMQAQLLSFPEVTKENYEAAEQAIMDLATRTGHSLHDVSIMVGKALGDPTKGITALRRVGVEFSESQTKLIKNLAETGHVAKAQQMILKELSREYAGSTAAASATAGGQMEILKHRFDEVKESIGKLLMEEVVKLAPELKKLIDDFKQLVEWIDKHREGLKELIDVIILVTASMWAFSKAAAGVELVTKAWELLGLAVGKTKSEIISANTASETATIANIGAGGGEAVASSLVAGLSVVGGALLVALSAASIAGVAKGIYDMQHPFGDKPGGEKAKDLGNGYVSAFGQTYKKDIFGNLVETTDNPVKNGEETGNDYLLKHFKEYKNSKDEFQQDLYKKGLELSKLQHSKTTHPIKEDIAANAQLKQQQLSTTGQQIKNIYVTINDGIGNHMTIKAASIKEAAPDIKKLITGALTDALNDAQISGGE